MESRIGPVWAARNGYFSAGDGDGLGNVTLENTGIAIQPGQWQKVSLLIDPGTKTYQFYVDGRPYEAPDPLGFRGNPASIETVDYLAIAIANLVSAFDPEMIVLGGGVSHSADLLIRPIMNRIEMALPNPPRLVVSDLGLKATVMGAITNVLHNTSNFYVVHKLS